MKKLNIKIKTDDKEFEINLSGDGDGIEEMIADAENILSDAEGGMLPDDVKVEVINVR